MIWIIVTYTVLGLITSLIAVINEYRHPDPYLVRPLRKPQLIFMGILVTAVWPIVAIAFVIDRMDK